MRFLDLERIGVSRKITDFFNFLHKKYNKNKETIINENLEKFKFKIRVK